jgi:uncharacterized protein YggT (Ycf19 family)
MTHRDPVTGETHEHVVEERVVTPVAPAPAPAPGDQVNVNAAGGTAPVYVEETSPLVYVRRVVGLIFGIFIALIAIRVILLALGANEGNALVDGIYGITEPLVAPFRGVFSLDEVRPTGASVIDIAALVAIVGWSLIALVILAILRIPDRA